MRAPSRFLAATAIAIAIGAGSPRPALAQPKPAPSVITPDAGAPAEEIAPDSPRASVKRYLELCRAGEYAEAAVYLDLPDAQKAQGPLLARRLKAVLDRQIWIKLDDISAQKLGDSGDHLPIGVEEIGTVPGATGPEPVRLVRKKTPEGTRWMFSRSTVEHIDAWFARISDRWAQDHLPERLLRPGPQDLLWWQWIALPILFGAALAAGNVMGWLTRRVIGRVVASTKATWDDALHVRLGAPITFAWALAAVYLALPRVGLYPPAEAFMVRLIRAGAFISVFWLGIRSIDVAGERVLELPRAKENPAARSLVPLGAKATKIAVVAIAIIAVLSELGYPVASLVAGLGIGGVALALAAQKTVENLFGSLSIGIDQPFRVGDYITVDGLSGTVESIGLRSTRLRTPDRTLVTMPNGKLADMRVESFTERDRIRFAAILGLARDTPSAALREVLEKSRRYLSDHPKAFPDVTVALVKIGESSLDVEVTAWFLTTSASEFTTLREEALLGLLAIIEAAGARLAVPTRALEMRA